MGKQKNPNELRITNIPPDVKRQLSNIAQYKGITLTQLVKIELRGVVDGYPPHIKQDLLEEN